MAIKFHNPNSVDLVKGQWYMVCMQSYVKGSKTKTEEKMLMVLQFLGMEGEYPIFNVLEPLITSVYDTSPLVDREFYKDERAGSLTVLSQMVRVAL